MAEREREMSEKNLEKRKKRMKESKRQEAEAEASGKVRERGEAGKAITNERIPPQPALRISSNLDRPNHIY